MEAAAMGLIIATIASTACLYYIFSPIIIRLKRKGQADLDQEIWYIERSRPAPLPNPTPHPSSAPQAARLLSALLHVQQGVLKLG